MSVLVRNEQIKLLATAVNNLGVASIAAGVIAPTAAYLLGTLQVDDPFRLLSYTVIWFFIGGSLLMGARRLLRGLV